MGELNDVVIRLSSDHSLFWDENIGGCTNKDNATKFHSEEAAQKIIDEFGDSHEGEMTWRVIIA
jgi:hypothetical protein